MRTGFKLTSQGMTTYGGFRWRVGEWVETSGEGPLPLCSAGWTHWYDGPELAVLMNPIHAEIENPRLWRGETDGVFAEDHGCKFGATRGRILEEMPLPQCAIKQRTEFGIVCALLVYHEPGYVAWARDWLTGRDRSYEAAARAAERATAWAAAAAAEAAARAARSSAPSAAGAAAWAVEAAASRISYAMPPLAEIARDILSGRPRGEQ